MKIIVDNSGEYSDVIISRLVNDLMKFNDESEDEVLFLGYNTSRDVNLKNKYAGFRKRIYLNWEAPCSFITTTTAIEEQKYFTHIYTICPYSAEWLKDKISTEVIPIAFPISLNSFSSISNEKEFDVIYMGTLMNQSHSEIIDVIKQYNYIFTSLVNYHPPYTPTHVNIGCVEKWQLLSKSKISVCVNQAPFGLERLANIKSYLNWEQHKAFTQIQNCTMPQFKSRITEAMGLRTLNLVKRDEWNVIENWFKPDVHFVYYNDKNDLKSNIDHILANYGDYQHIIDNAYEEVEKYDINNIYTNYMLK